MNQASARLAGARLLAARVLWLAIVAPSLALFFAGVPTYYMRLQRPCVNMATCNVALALTANGLRAMIALGVSPARYALFGVSFWLVIVGVWTALGFLIFTRRSDDWFALLSAFALVMFNLSYPGLFGTALALDYPALSAPATVIGALGLTTFNLFFLLFPNGRLAPRWTALIIPLIIAQSVATTLPPTSPFAIPNLPGWIDALLALVIYFAIIASQVYRYRTASSAVERQQTKWVAFAIVSVAVGFVALGALFTVVFPWMNDSGAPANLISLVYPLLLLLIPVSVGFATLRYRLWDIELVIRRTVVYGLLTAFVVGCYVVVVGYLGILFRTGDNLLISLIATGVVAVLFQPLRMLLQRGVTRLVYGQRDEPYVVLRGLGQRLKATLGPDETLQVIVTTVREALKLSYVGVEEQRNGTVALVASSGSAPERAQTRLPLSDQTEAVGALVVAPRGRDQALTPGDLRLLDDLTQQIGAALRAVRLTSDLRALTQELQRSREHLVVAREEERRRLRRDLHDGLGPTLSAIMLKVGLARALQRRDAGSADALLAQLETEIAAVLDEIRRLVYDLRPPALDELGLVGAIREFIERLSTGARGGAPTPAMTLETSGPLTPLPAAVEVAAYRITQEAVTNVVRHARANACYVHVQENEGALQIEIRDDGVGISRAAQSGVGLRSMRERATELDGTLTIERLASGGTRVFARLPLAAAVAEIEEDVVESRGAR